MRVSALFMNGALPVAMLVCGLWRPIAHAQPVQRGENVELVGRSIKAINYQHRSGATKIDFRGTPILSGAGGEAKVESKRGYLEIDAEFRGLSPARRFGSEYFTYVLWAITPDGRPENLGEILLKDDRGKLEVTTQLQAFGLVVTAEPYFSVTYPSDVVVLENAVRTDTRGRVDEIEARYELLRRGQYISNEKPDELTAKLMVVDPKAPLQLYEARNAIRIARWTGAEKYAPEPFNKAVEQLLAAERYQARRRPETKAAAMMARQAVQTAEDARLLTVRRLEEERLAAERKAAAERESAAMAKADAESLRRAKAESDMQQAERLRAEAEAARQRADVAEKEELFDNRDHGIRAHALARGPKKLVSIPGITHYGIYREAREQATRLAIEWFDEHLKGAK